MIFSLKRIFTPYLTIWYKPQATAVQFAQQKNKIYNFLFISLLAFGFLLDLLFFHFVIDLWPDNLFSLVGLKWIAVFTFLFGAIIYTLMTSIALFTWMMAKSLGGIGNISQTRSVLLLSLIVLLPLGLCFCLLVSALQNDPTSIVSALLMFVCIILLVYALVIFLKTLSGVHHFNFFRSLISLFAGIITGSLLVLFLYKTITPIWRMF